MAVDVSVGVALVVGGTNGVAVAVGVFVIMTGDVEVGVTGIGVGVRVLVGISPEADNVITS